ncbi:MAG TPA: hypothetical protein VFQ68_06995 [Streptosporangiaceae bacterium]|nr:hypothetical protein [Streptosporangiaceae bacterium]
MDRHTHRLVSEIITVLERHGHHARDREHADRVCTVIQDEDGGVIHGEDVRVRERPRRR